MGTQATTRYLNPIVQMKKGPRRNAPVPRTKKLSFLEPSEPESHLARDLSADDVAKDVLLHFLVEDIGA